MWTSGCSSARLEYTSGGRVVAGSNPVIPTSEQVAELIVLLLFFCSQSSRVLAHDDGSKKKRRFAYYLPMEDGWHSLIMVAGLIVLRATP